MAGLLLGSIQFTEREIPDRVFVGTKQVIAIHRLMGGTRVLDTLGPDPEPISWKGLFLGSNASVRARAVDTLSKSGAEVNLSWGTFNYTVVVSNFKFVYKNEWEVAYSIVVEVVGEDASAATLTLSDLVTSDISEINNIATANPTTPAVPGSQTINASMVSALSELQSTIATAVGTQDLEDLSLAQLEPVLNQAEDTFAAFEAGSGTPQGIDLSAETATSVIDGINAFVAEYNLIAAESDVKTALGYLGRIVGNISSSGG